MGRAGQTTVGLCNVGGCSRSENGTMTRKRKEIYSRRWKRSSNGCRCQLRCESGRTLSWRSSAFQTPHAGACWKSKPIMFITAVFELHNHLKLPAQCLPQSALLSSVLLCSCIRRDSAYHGGERFPATDLVLSFTHESLYMSIP